MALNAGTRLGPYEIVAAIGAGGMGEVYKARDMRLKRDVALKVLPEFFATDPDRLARFQREAEVLASLSHPNIAAIHGLEESDGIRALVMELVEGETLADRIARGPIPLDEALPIAKQIAEALEAAHEQGIIHRDLKPANIKLRPDGAVKVLDFGLAKALEPSPVGSTAVSLSPTITSPAMMTGVGVLLGTAAYMAPEQAKGRAADKRADCWAFGCVLYEMLTGKRPFDGEDVTETLAAILMREPDWSALPPATPLAIRTLLKGCLEKNRRDRFADISTPRFLLSERASALVERVEVPVPGPPDPAVIQPQIDAAVSTARLQLAKRSRRRAALVGLITLVAGGGIAGAAVWFATRPAPPRVSRLTISAPRSALPSSNASDLDLAITPDGSRVVYIGDNGAQLFVRALDAAGPASVFKGAPRGLFISPNGQWIGFVDGVTGLKKVAITGGPSVTVATFDSAPRGATWTADDSIIFATLSAGTGLLRVPATGGTPVVLTRPDRAHGEQDHLWPEMLPGDRAVLFTITALAGGLDAAQVAVLDLQTGTRKILIRGGSHAHYVTSGHLVYTTAGTLRAVAFDLARLEVRGTAVPVVADVVTWTTGGADAAIARNGTLAYLSGSGTGAGARVQRTMFWVDRQGHETPLPTSPQAFIYPRLSPDQQRVAVASQESDIDIWLWDLARTTLTRFTFDPGIDTYPLWTPDGRRIIFSSERAGARNIFSQPADGTGSVERLTESPNIQNASAVSPDGSRLIFSETMPQTNEDIMQVELTGKHRVTPLVQSPFSERNGIVSPDGRWLAYEATDSGRVEIYVRPYPDVNSGHWQVSTGGGVRPLWSRNGQELFYISLSGALMRVGVERGQSWAATTPTLLLKGGYYTNPGAFLGRSYDVSADGQRFLMLKEGSASDQDSTQSSITIVQNWGEELKRLVPAK